MDDFDDFIFYRVDKWMTLMTLGSICVQLPRQWYPSLIKNFLRRIAQAMKRKILQLQGITYAWVYGTNWFCIDRLINDLPPKPRSTELLGIFYLYRISIGYDTLRVPLDVWRILVLK